MRRLERLLALALFLGARRRVRATDAAAHFAVTPRTIYRDVRALIAAGFPIEGTAGDGYRVLQDAYLRPLALSDDEAEALAVASRALGASVSGPLRDALATATAKLSATLNPAARRRMAQLESRIVVPAFARGTAPTSAMLDSIREHRAAQIRYENPQTARASLRTLEPVGLVCRGDAWWIIGYCRAKRGARAFRVDAVRGWTDAGPFTLRPGFSFDEIVARDRHLAPALFGY